MYNDDWKACVIFFAVVVGLFAAGAAVIKSTNTASVERAKISSQKEVQKAQIIQEEKTKRTVERSKFWQNLTPWAKKDDK